MAKSEIIKFPKPTVKGGQNRIKEEINHLMREKGVPETVCERIMDEFEIYKFAYDPKFNVLNFDYGDKFTIDDIDGLSEEQMRAISEAVKSKIKSILDQVKADVLFTLMVKIMLPLHIRAVMAELQE